MAATVVARHEDRIVWQLRAWFVETYGASDAARRAQEIAARPSVVWKGRTLRTIRCHGDYGKGPHDVHLPESVLWNLISLDHYRCVYHTR
jgi:hypothetical protein